MPQPPLAFILSELGLEGMNLKILNMFQVTFPVICLFFSYLPPLLAGSLVYLYDDLDRLKEVHFDNKAIIYTYDNIGNRTSLKIQSIADLKITLELDQTVVTIGNTFSYTVTIINQGQLATSGVFITLLPESGIQIISSDSDVCFVEPPVTCWVENVGVNEAKTIRFIALPLTAGVLTTQINVVSNEHDPVEGDNHAEASVTVELSNIATDLDNDQILDNWEESNGLNPLFFGDASQDFDADDLTNLQEFSAGTQPYNSDTDSDGLPDGWEINNGLNATSSGDEN